jgi:type VI secretion system secreted protein Hcp
MPVEIFFKLDGVDGESTAKGHEKWIELQSFSWGCNQSTGGTGGGGPHLQDLSIVFTSNKASTKLFEACSTGSPFDKGTLEITKAGKEPFYKVTFSDCLVSAFESGGASGDPIPTDSVSLNFFKVEFGTGPPPPPPA